MQSYSRIQDLTVQLEMIREILRLLLIQVAGLLVLSRQLKWLLQRMLSRGWQQHGKDLLRESSCWPWGPKSSLSPTATKPLMWHSCCFLSDQQQQDASEWKNFGMFVFTSICRPRWLTLSGNSHRLHPKPHLDSLQEDLRRRVWSGRLHFQLRPTCQIIIVIPLSCW